MQFSPKYCVFVTEPLILVQITIHIYFKSKTIFIPHQKTIENLFFNIAIFLNCFGEEPPTPVQ